jgi:hypothetical protein
MDRGAYPQTVRKLAIVPGVEPAQLPGQARGVPRGLADRQDLGVWNGELLPVRWETIQVGLRDVYKVRRVYRKLARRKGCGRLNRITVFVRYENVLRLLRFLGYCLE